MDGFSAEGLEAARADERASTAGDLGDRDRVARGICFVFGNQGRVHGTTYLQLCCHSQHIITHMRHCTVPPAHRLIRGETVEKTTTIHETRTHAGHKRIGRRVEVMGAPRRAHTALPCGDEPEGELTQCAPRDAI